VKTINATEFKAKCLAILDEVNQTHEGIIILKRGVPVARLVPPIGDDETYAQDGLRGSVTIHGDIIEPVLPPDAWEAEGISE